MDLPTHSEEALSQPTRARIFELLVEARGPLRTREVADRLEMHVNGVRRHLERLSEEGLVERRQERGGRGRPSDHWVVAADAQPGGESPTAYAELAAWLAEAMPDDPETVRRAVEVGRRVGRQLRAEAPADGNGSIDRLFNDTFAALGFQPHTVESDDGCFVASLGNCPYVDSAVANPRVVCGLHRGMTEGFLERGDGPGPELVEFKPEDPRQAGCTVTVR